MRTGDGKPAPGVVVEFDLVTPGAHFLGQAVTESVASSEIHLELMDSYRRISSYSTNIGRAIRSKDRFGHPE